MISLLSESSQQNSLLAEVREAELYGHRALQRNAAQCEEITMSRSPTHCLRHRAKPLLFSLVGLLPMATGSTASAAVNVCMPLVKAAPVEANTATDAKRSALANWRMDASMHGVEYTGCRLGPS
jgi:hypothetical protein